MKTTTLTADSLSTQAAYYRLRLEQCVDIIKQLSGDIPDSFSFVFTIREKTIVTFEIHEGESEFMMGIFMAWHSYFQRALRSIESSSLPPNFL